MNIAQWIRRVEGDFTRSSIHFGHGTDNAHDEAAWLVLHVMGAELDGSFKDGQQPVSEEQAIAIGRLVQRRILENLPLAYLTGKAWFAGLEFHINRDVLVPRSPMAELIMDQFQPWIDTSTVKSALDMCTGCGCIAIAIAANMPQLRVDAADISRLALQVAAQNVTRHELQNRVSLIETDLFQSLAGVKYDLIVANPPYVPAGSLHGLPAEYRAEPALGLVSGADGLDIPLRILAAAANHLERNGLLVCEVGESEQRLSRLLPELPFLWLEFENGGSGVFMLTKKQLQQAGAAIAAALEERKDV